MFNTKLFFSLLSLFTLIGRLQSQAQSIQNNSGTPIETKADLGFMAILGGDMKSNLSGQRIYRYQDFKNLIYSFHDPEASDLIRQAKATDLIFWIVLTAGLSTSLDIALFL